MPKYSPNLNEIEHDFSALKRARMYLPINTYIDKLFVIIVPDSVSFLFKKNYILNYALQFIIQIKSNKFCIKLRYDY